MDIIALTKDISTALIPVLPYLLKTGGKASEENGKKANRETWEKAKELWARLRTQVEARPAALEAARDVAEAPDDEDAQAALRVQLKKLLVEDKALAQTLAHFLDEGRSEGSQLRASGERSVAIGGDVVGSAIITGEGNVVGVRLKPRAKKYDDY